MGKFMFALIFLFSANFSIGQEKIKKNELGVSFFKISTFYYQNIFIQKLPFKDFRGVNISIKKQIKPTLFIRTSISHYKQKFNSPDLKASSSCFDCDPTKMTVNESYLNLGIERRKIKSQSKKIGFYSGIDLTLLYLKAKGTIEGWSAFESANQIIKGAGVQPFIGFKTYLFKRVSFSMESSLLISGVKSNYFYKKAYPPYEEYTSNKNLIYGQFNLLRLFSFNYNF